MAKCPDCAGTDHSNCARCDNNGDLALSDLSIEERATIDGADLDNEYVYMKRADDAGPGDPLTEPGLGHAEYTAAREAAQAAAARA